MTVRRLINMLAPLSQGADTRSLRNDALTQVQRPNDSTITAFFEQATIAYMNSDGSFAAEFHGGLIDVQPETDDVFNAGQDVWISLTKEGIYICHGAVIQ